MQKQNKTKTGISCHVILHSA